MPHCVEDRLWHMELWLNITDQIRHVSTQCILLTLLYISSMTSSGKFVCFLYHLELLDEVCGWVTWYYTYGVWITSCEFRIHQKGLTREWFGSGFLNETSCSYHFHLQLAFLIHHANLNVTWTSQNMQWKTKLNGTFA